MEKKYTIFKIKSDKRENLLIKILRSLQQLKKKIQTCFFF